MTDTRIIEWTRSVSEFYRPDLPPPSRDVYFAWDPFNTGDANPWLAHFCLDLQGNHRPRWIWQGTGLHTLVSRDPLHLEASIGWMACCGRHGHIRNGQWEPSVDGGWTP